MLKLHIIRWSNHKWKVLWNWHFVLKCFQCWVYCVPFFFLIHSVNCCFCLLCFSSKEEFLYLCRNSCCAEFSARYRQCSALCRYHWRLMVGILKSDRAIESSNDFLVGTKGFQPIFSSKISFSVQTLKLLRDSSFPIPVVPSGVAPWSLFSAITYGSHHFCPGPFPPFDGKWILFHIRE